jgi:hypothetical protein
MGKNEQAQPSHESGVILGLYQLGRRGGLVRQSRYPQRYRQCTGAFDLSDLPTVPGGRRQFIISHMIGSFLDGSSVRIFQT